MEILIPSSYLGPIQQYAWMLRADTTYVEQYDHYQKQTFRNRCIIAAADGALPLTIPVEKYDGSKCPMKDIRISDHGNWRHLHWNALVSAYQATPFFEYYQDEFRPFYEKKFEFLIDFNEALDAKIFELIDLHPVIKRTIAYGEPAAEVDLRSAITPKHPREDSIFIPQPYYQVFQQKYGFLPNLSIVDLLFNMGPESLLVLRDSIRK